MNIPYTLRSDVVTPRQEGITVQQEALNAGQVIQIMLEAEKDGYLGNVHMSIAAGNLSEFETNWSASDPTRFPARLKAAATALRNCGCWGSFNITHAEGAVSIRKAG